MLENYQETRVNFSKSNLHWGGASKGIFKIVAVLTKESEDPLGGYITYALGQSVLAGNMYVKKTLLKKPAYLFQVVGSTDEQFIYRTFMPNQEPKNFPDWIHKDKCTGDTYGDPLFKEFYIDIRKESAKAIYDYDEIEGLYSFNNFTAKVTLNENFKEFAQMEFPINHINVMHNKKMWQVETGPVLFPVFDELNINQIRLVPSFVHFNNYKTIDIFCDYPFGFRNKDMRNNGIYGNIGCEIEIYAGCPN
mgnify:CR=1 FL=1|jgi:hypothetical protein|tara:strand:+ start:425 stop:1171 length:747 start_codon:yes stop_codon:yes gene_type:complete